MNLPCGHLIIHDACKHCQELQAKWYDKIKKDFDDAESIRYPDRPLKEWTSHAFKDLTFEEIEDRQAYTDKAQELLHSFTFKNTTHRRIWQLHCEGLSRYQIADQIKHLKITYKQARIRQIILDLQRELDW